MRRRHLVPSQVGHADELFVHLSHPELYAFIPGEPLLDVGTVRATFARFMAGSPDGSEAWLNWVVFDGGRAIGTLQATIDADHNAIVAYVVFRRFWRRRYATRGLGWLLEELFERRGVQCASAYVDLRNEPSLAVARALAMQTIREEEGDEVLTITRDDWQPSRP